MRKGKLSIKLGPWRLRFDYLGPYMDAADPWRWQLVIGPFEIEYRSTLDRLVQHDLAQCEAVLGSELRGVLDIAKLMNAPLPKVFP